VEATGGRRRDERRRGETAGSDGRKQKGERHGMFAPRARRCVVTAEAPRWNVE
jgi:hypothetical protein